MIEVTDCIPKERFDLWQDTFSQSGGRYSSNPLMPTSNAGVWVRYSFVCEEEYSAFCDLWNTLTTPIVETNRSRWKKMKVKLTKWWNK